MFQTLKNAFKVKEIRVKIWMTLVFILIYRLGCYIPVPGIGGELISSSELSKVSYLGLLWVSALTLTLPLSFSF